METNRIKPKQKIDVKGTLLSMQVNDEVIFPHGKVVTSTLKAALSRFNKPKNIDKNYQHKFTSVDEEIGFIVTRIK